MLDKQAWGCYYGSTMTRQDRDRVRAKQDRLLELSAKVPRDYRIAAGYPGSPTLLQIASTLYPEWETVIDQAILDLEREW
jgi:hypothetical protein